MVNKEGLINKKPLELINCTILSLIWQYEIGRKT